mmetsp:Transcript_11726/g.33160  ORF Transcript_11726/g.33160 Transcript_11726/m.33160 type:complete len:203 (+) Transcript_11726:166-774(+)
MAWRAAVVQGRAEAALVEGRPSHCHRCPGALRPLLEGWSCPSQTLSGGHGYQFRCCCGSASLPSGARKPRASCLAPPPPPPHLRGPSLGRRPGPRAYLPPVSPGTLVKAVRPATSATLATWGAKTEQCQDWPRHRKENPQPLRKKPRRRLLPPPPPLQQVEGRQGTEEAAGAEVWRAARSLAAAGLCRRPPRVRPLGCLQPG